MSWDNTWRHRLGAFGDGSRIGDHVVITNPERVFLGKNVRIDPFCYISGEIRVGDNVQICSHAVLGGRAGITLGDWTFVGYGSKLFTASEDYKYLVNEYWGATHAHVEPIEFENYAGVGSDVIVMPGITLKNGVRIGAQSFVYTTPEEPWSIYRGNPLKLHGRVDQLETVAEGVRKG